jgi:hypothetical protein
MSMRLVPPLAGAFIVALLGMPAASLAVTPVDESGSSASSAPKVNPPSPSNESTTTTSGASGSSTMPQPGTGSKVETLPGSTGSSTETRATPPGAAAPGTGSKVESLPQPDEQKASGGASK